MKLPLWIALLTGAVLLTACGGDNVKGAPGGDHGAMRFLGFDESSLNNGCVSTYSGDFSHAGAGAGSSVTWTYMGQMCGLKAGR